MFIQDPWEGKELFLKSEQLQEPPCQCSQLLAAAFTTLALSALSLTFKLGSMEDGILLQLNWLS